MTEREEPANSLPSSPSADSQAWQQRAELERALLEKLRQPGRTGIPRRSTTGPCPASFAQSRLWYIEQLEPDLPLYHMQSAYRMRGPLDVQALQRSVNEIVKRHEALRTTFTAPEGHLLQVVHPTLDLPLPVVEVNAPPGREMEAVQALAREHVWRSFDLAEGPLLRVTLLRLGPEDHVLLLAMHHVVSDAWSMAIFAEELSLLYDAFRQGRPCPLPPLPIQYADFGLWQRAMMEGEALQKQLDFWTKHLAGAPLTLDLPTDRPRPARALYNGARLLHPLPAALVEAAQTFGTKQQATPFMVFLAGFAIALQRYTGRDDLLIGTPIANRTHVDVERLIGFFVNTLVLRIDLSGNPTFRELVQRVREVALNAYEHQDLPFERLVEELQPQRDLSRNAVFQVLFQLLSLPPAGLQLPGLLVERLEQDSGIAPMDLALTVLPNENPATIWADYSTDLYDRATIQRLMLHYQTLLEAAIANPDERIGYLPMLTPQERQLVLAEWNRTQQEPPQQCVQQMIEEQVERSPEATAVRFAQQTLTYGELNARANQLAHYLRRQGVGPETIVAIAMGRSLDMVVALLGILKAGGAYLPLDPDHPAERLQFMLEQSGARLLLAQEPWADSAYSKALAAAPVVYLDFARAAIAAESCDNPPNQAGPDNLAYVLYTSGSTGKPKAVMVSHLAVSNHTAWFRQAYGLGPEDRVIQVAPLSFDASVPEIFATLAAGAQVVLPPPHLEMDPAGIVEFMADERITVLTAVPTLLQAMLDEPGFSRCRHLRCILCGGEAVPSTLEAQMLATGVPEVYCGWGLTEATVDSTSWRCGPAHGRPTVPIGRPVANTQVYVLDRHLQPVPVGVTGEIFVGGAGLARGYLGDPELTALKFVPSPWGPAGVRLFRTGDLGRWMPDGNLECLGRLDHQIKLRGLRIELGEIENVLRQHPAVLDSAVLVHDHAQTGRRLVAYAVARVKPPPPNQEVFAFLQQTLPAYMIPAQLIWLDSMPVTPSGKVDRRALPAPTDIAMAGESFVAPRNAMEAGIAEVWRQVLNLEQVGVHDNFFDLGGHSLLAMRAIALIEKRLGVRLSPRDFMFNTLAQIAALCAERAGEPPQHKAPPRGGLRQSIQRLLRRDAS